MTADIVKLLIGKLAIVTIAHASGTPAAPSPPLHQVAKLPLMAQTSLTELPTLSLKPVASSSTPVATRPAIAGNAYPLFQCTWYVKSRRPDIPNHLGNANLWFAELKALGWSVGFTPRAGAIGQEIGGMHVVYVEYVNSDGSIHLSERNYDYHGSFRYRDAPASGFEYVY